MSIRTTPEKILLAMARKASVIGMSASAEFKTVLNNYNLDYLKEELGPDYHITESALKTEIAAELVKRNIPYKNKEIKCHGFRISAERNYFENKECRKILVQKMKYLIVINKVVINKIGIWLLLMFSTYFAQVI